MKNGMSRFVTTCVLKTKYWSELTKLAKFGENASEECGRMSQCSELLIEISQKQQNEVIARRFLSKQSWFSFVLKRLLLRFAPRDNFFRSLKPWTRNHGFSCMNCQLKVCKTGKGYVSKMNAFEKSKRGNRNAFQWLIGRVSFLF